MRRFEGLTVLITGAAGGFGQKMAERFSEEGARLVLSDLNEAGLADVAARISTEQVSLVGDITDEALSENLVKLAEERFGTLDIAINNAGIAQNFVKLPLVPSDEARQVLETNLLGVFYALKHQLPFMARQYRATGMPAAIVNMASLAGLNGVARLSVYAAAKHGVVGLTRSAAAEYAAKGVRVNAICPSYARTDMVCDAAKVAGDQEEAIAAITRDVPMRRPAEIAEVIEAVLFAADPKNSFMTGHALAIDGGASAI